MPGDSSKFVITPDTKVGELLERHPRLEEVLIGISPAYKALKNPVLRRTVARVATLRQVSKVGNVALGELIGKLRQAAGMEHAAGDFEEARTDEARPAWAVPAAVIRTFDARPLIESGGHPLAQVMGDLAGIKAGQVYELVTPFIPAPLIDLAKGKGFVAYSALESPNLARTYLTLSRVSIGSEPAREE